MRSRAASEEKHDTPACRWIVANEMTITGSIGVILHSFNYRGLMDKIGLRPEVYKSGKYKDMLSGDKKDSDITAEEREMVQNLINETFGQFTNVVAKGREQASQKNKNNSEAKGRTLSG